MNFNRSLGRYSLRCLCRGSVPIASGFCSWLFCQRSTISAASSESTNLAASCIDTPIISTSFSCGAGSACSATGVTVAAQDSCLADGSTPIFGNEDAGLPGCAEGAWKGQAGVWKCTIMLGAMLTSFRTWTSVAILGAGFTDICAGFDGDETALGLSLE